MVKSQVFNKLTSNPLAAYIVITLFIIVKLFHLNVSFFWDESWVYAPAVQAMAEAGPSLLPDSISLDYSRGHPLLFHFLAGVWIKIFGSGFVSMHGFPLLLSIFYLLVCNKLFTRIFNQSTAFWIILLLAIQSIFMAQSSMVLPEVQLALFTICSFYFHIKKKYWLYLIFGALTILTKETGILAIISIVLFDFVQNLWSRKSLIGILRKGILLSLPLLVLIGHMLYLKSAFGWYLYPEHTGMVKYDFDLIFSSFSNLINDQIFMQKRFLITLPFVLLYIFKLIKSQSFLNYIFLAISGILAAFLFTFKGEQFIAPSLFFLMLSHYSISKFVEQSEKGKYLLLFFLFATLYGLFSAANFYTVRYLLSTLVFLLAIPIYFLLNEAIFRKYIPIYLILTLVAFTIELINPRGVNDINLSYLYYCPAQTEVVSYLREKNLQDEQINTMFLMSVALSDKRAGYLNENDSFQFLNKENGQDKDYWIFYNAEANNNRDRLQKSENGQVMKRIEKKHIWFEIWKEEL